MRPGQNKRMRGRSNHSGGRKGPNPLTRSFESNGPDVKIRGTAQHIAEKYLQLARDAQSSGDPVMAENYLQHAEHYYRVIAAAQAGPAAGDGPCAPRRRRKSRRRTTASRRTTVLPPSPIVCPSRRRRCRSRPTTHSPPNGQPYQGQQPSAATIRWRAPALSGRGSSVPWRDNRTTTATTGRTTRRIGRTPTTGRTIGQDGNRGEQRSDTSGGERQERALIVPGATSSAAARAANRAERPVDERGGSARLHHGLAPRSRRPPAPARRTPTPAAHGRRRRQRLSPASPPPAARPPGDRPKAICGEAEPMLPQADTVPASE